MELLKKCSSSKISHNLREADLITRYARCISDRPAVSESGHYVISQVHHIARSQQTLVTCMTPCLGFCATSLCSVCFVCQSSAFLCISPAWKNRGLSTPVSMQRANLQFPPGRAGSLLPPHQSTATRPLGQLLSKSLSTPTTITRTMCAWLLLWRRRT